MTQKPFIGFRIEGAKELEALLRDLPKSVGDSALKSAGKKALQPVANAARLIAQTNSAKTGDMAASIGVTTTLSKRQKKRHAKPGDVYVYAGPAGKYKQAHLIEFGTKDRYTKRGAYRGRGPAEPFMRPAWDANDQLVLKIFQTEIWNTLKAAVKRLRRTAEAGKASKSVVRHFTGG